MSAHREGSVPTLRVFYLERDAAWYWIETDECGVDVGQQHGPFDTALLAGSDARRAVIDLTRQLDIDVGLEDFAPLDQRYSAVDRNTWDGDGKCNVVGRGPTKREAIADLLEKLAEARS